MKHDATTFLTIIMVALFALPGVGAAVTMEDINVHGFVSQGYINSSKDMNFLLSNSSDGSWEFNELAINFSTRPADNLSLGIQLAAFDQGELGNDEVHVDWAFGDYSLREYLGVQGGIMKIPFGLYNEVRKIDMVHTNILLPTSVYPEWFREAFARIKGVGLYGNLPGNISYRAMYGHMDITTDGGLAVALETLLGGMGMKTTDTNTDFAYAGNIQWQSPFGLRLIAGLYTLNELEMTMSSTLDLPSAADLAPFDSDLAKLVGGLDALGIATTPITGQLHFEPVKTYVLSAEYMIDRLTLAAEYVEYDIEFTYNISTNLDSTLSAAMGIPTQLERKMTMQGYYGSVAYRLLEQLEIGAYYSELYYHKNDRSGKKYADKFGADKPDFNAWLKEICLSARYDLTASWSAKIEGHFMNGTFMAYNSDHEDWALYAAKLSYSF